VPLPDPARGIPCESGFPYTSNVLVEAVIQFAAAFTHEIPPWISYAVSARIGGCYEFFYDFPHRRLIDGG